MISEKHAIPIPIIGLGTCLGRSYFLQCSAKENEEWYSTVIQNAIELGYRHFDCAQMYGTQAAIGKALEVCTNKEYISRSNLFLTSKIWNTHHSHDRAVSALKQSLLDLKTDFLDLCLIHWPQGYKEVDGTFFPFDENMKMSMSNIGYLETYKALEECVDNGLVKYIGISNFNIEQLKIVLDICRIRPAILQIELNPYLTQKELRDFCAKEKIVVTGYCPLGNPGRAKENTPTNAPPDLISNPVVKSVAERHCRTPAQVLLRWSIQHDVVVVPKTVNRDRMVENMQVFDFTLSEKDMTELDSLNVNYHGVALEWDRDHPHYPF